MTALLEAWLIVFLLAAGWIAGSLAVLAITYALGDEASLRSLRPPLETAARSAPVLLVLALPILLGADLLYSEPHRWGVFALRTAAVLLVWAALGRLLLRQRAAGWVAGVTLVLLVLTASVGYEDWALSRDAAWTGSLQAVAILVEQSGAALALAALLAIRRNGLPSNETRTGLERTLLTFAMATLWLWFVQFVTVWAANVPAEAAWYSRRMSGAWAWLHAAVALPALLGAIGLALVPQWRRWRLAAVCALLLVQHAAHLAWIVRPDAPGPAAAWADALGAAVIALALVAAWRWAEASRPPLVITASGAGINETERLRAALRDLRARMGISGGRRDG